MLIRVCSSALLAMLVGNFSYRKVINVLLQLEAEKYIFRQNKSKYWLVIKILSVLASARAKWSGRVWKKHGKNPTAASICNHKSREEYSLVTVFAVVADGKVFRVDQKWNVLMWPDRISFARFVKVQWRMIKNKLIRWNYTTPRIH